MKINTNQSCDTDQYLTAAEQLVMHEVLAEMLENLQKAGCTAAEVSLFFASAMTENQIQIAHAIVGIRKGIEDRERAKAVATSEDVF